VRRQLRSHPDPVRHGSCCLLLLLLSAVEPGVNVASRLRRCSYAGEMPPPVRYTGALGVSAAPARFRPARPVCVLL
jgi:hypothetical protein